MSSLLVAKATTKPLIYDFKNATWTRCIWIGWNKRFTWTGRKLWCQLFQPCLQVELISTLEGVVQGLFLLTSELFCYFYSWRWTTSVGFLLSFLFPSPWFVCIASYPFTVFPSACLFSFWPFTRYLKTEMKLVLYYLFFRLNKPGSSSHKDNTPDAASQVSNTVEKTIFCHQAAILLCGVIFQQQEPNATCIQFVAHQNSQDVLMDLLFSSCSPFHTVVWG